MNQLKTSKQQQQNHCSCLCDERVENSWMNKAAAHQTVIAKAIFKNLLVEIKIKKKGEEETSSMVHTSAFIKKC